MVKVNFKLEIPTIDCYFFDPFSDQEELAKDLEELTKLYDERPFDNTGGIKFGGAFAYYCLLKRIAPNIVIESGIWRGFSTYIIEQTLPDSSLICLDPVLMFPLLSATPIYRPTKAFYSTQDFSCFYIGSETASQACVIFDDHQNVLPRIQQAFEKGIQHIIIDDNGDSETDHETISFLIKQKDPLLSYIFDFIEEYYVFPQLFTDMDGYPVKSIWNKIPARLQHLDVQQESNFVHAWTTYIKLKQNL